MNSNLGPSGENTQKQQFGLGNTGMLTLPPPSHPQNNNRIGNRQNSPFRNQLNPLGDEFKANDILGDQNNQNDYQVTMGSQQKTKNITQQKRPQGNLRQQKSNSPKGGVSPYATFPSSYMKNNFQAGASVQKTLTSVEYQTSSNCNSDLDDNYWQLHSEDSKPVVHEQGAQGNQQSSPLDGAGPSQESSAQSFLFQKGSLNHLQMLAQKHQQMGKGGQSPGGTTPYTKTGVPLLKKDVSSNEYPMIISHVELPNHEPTKLAQKENGIIRSYAANTNQGLIREYNEDRVSIVLNIQKPQNKSCERWPKTQFLSIFDGHGGHTCADFLRDNLHQFIVRDDHFPGNVKQAILNGFAKCEQYFLDTVEKFSAGKQSMLDRSGSCAIVTMFVDDLCYVANLGDSRAIMSCDGGRYLSELSRDHKPNDETEAKRIVAGGGKVYQTQSVVRVVDEQTKMFRDQIIHGPHRVYPGRLSVSRTFGDVEAKKVKYKGNPKVVISIPEIKCFKIEDSYDFMVLGCDGIFDKLSSQQVIKVTWECAKRRFENKDSQMHKICGSCVEAVLKASIFERTMDNITVAVIAFKNFKKCLKNELEVFNKALENQIQQTMPEFIDEQEYGKKVTGDNGSGLHGMGSDQSFKIRKKSVAGSDGRGQIDRQGISDTKLIDSATQLTSGIQICKTLNLPNYDLTIEDISLMSKQVGLGRMQGRTIGSLRSVPSNYLATQTGTTNTFNSLHHQSSAGSVKNNNANRGKTLGTRAQSKIQQSTGQQMNDEQKLLHFIEKARNNSVGQVQSSYNDAVINKNNNQIAGSFIRNNGTSRTQSPGNKGLVGYQTVSAIHNPPTQLIQHEQSLVSNHQQQNTFSNRRKQSHQIGIVKTSHDLTEARTTPTINQSLMQQARSNSISGTPQPQLDGRTTNRSPLQMNDSSFKPNIFNQPHMQLQTNRQGAGSISTAKAAAGPIIPRNLKSNSYFNKTQSQFTNSKIDSGQKVSGKQKPFGDIHIPGQTQQLRKQDQLNDASIDQVDLNKEKVRMAKTGSFFNPVKGASNAESIPVNVSSSFGQRKAHSIAPGPLTITSGPQAISQVKNNTFQSVQRGSNPNNVTVASLAASGQTFKGKNDKKLQDQMIQEQRYDNIVSQSRAKRQRGSTPMADDFLFPNDKNPFYETLPTASAVARNSPKFTTLDGSYKGRANNSPGLQLKQNNLVNVNRNADLQQANQILGVSAFNRGVTPNRAKQNQIKTQQDVIIEGSRGPSPISKLMPGQN